MPVESRLLTVKDLANYLGCTVWAARVLLWSNEIPHLVIGRRHLVDRKDVDAYIDRLKG